VSTTTADSDDEMALFVTSKNPQEKKGNSQYNNAFVQLVRDLERKGTKGSFSNKHLNLWADHIAQGLSCGADDPPNWEQYLDEIEFLPRDKKVKFTNFPAGQRRESLSDVFALHIARQEELDKRYMRDQNERREEQRSRDDMWRTTMLAMMSPRAVGAPSLSSATATATTTATASPTLVDMSVADVSKFLRGHGYDQNMATFELNCVDGAMLKHANHELLEALGMPCVIQRAKLLGLITKASR
jgi:hypothetical protein